MIKNDLQLKQTEQRCKELAEIIADLKQEYSGMQLELLKSGFEAELKKRRDEIQEYKQLLQLSLKEAIEGPLSRKPMLLGNINEFLTKLRIAAGLTQEEMAAKLGWHQPNVSRFESENYGGQTISKVVEYAGSLDVWLYTAPSASQIPPKITYQHDQEEIRAHARDQGVADVTFSHQQAEDTSASMASITESWNTGLSLGEFGAYEVRREEAYEPVTI